jgi:uncharacterized membrane protein YphA (DoxX/SURF4 family)
MDCRIGQNVKPASSSTVDKVTIVVRILLGGIFLYSCIGKIADPSAFAAILTNYQLFPPHLVSATAVVFPWIEAACGLALVFGRYEKGAALLVSLMMVVFIGIIQYNNYRGLNIACGCFSLSAEAPSNIVVNTLRNLFILAAGAWVLIYPKHQRLTPAR